MALFFMWNNSVVFFVAVLTCFILNVSGGAWAAQDWQAEERACRSACPPFPRFSGQESDAEYRDRMNRQAAHDRCFLECARKSSSRFAPSFTPIDKAAKDYYRRNGVKMGK